VTSSLPLADSIRLVWRWMVVIVVVAVAWAAYQLLVFHSDLRPFAKDAASLAGCVVYLCVLLVAMWRARVATSREEARRLRPRSPVDG
jgi:hypothetical protein